MNQLLSSGSLPPRIEFIDLLRGVALIAMTLFHFGWDLELLGFAERGFASQPAMVWFARIIASSFLFLVGFSLVLAHLDGLKLKPFMVRLAKVAGAALLITIATYFYSPDMFIFFGILHHIALASVISLALLRLPSLVLLALSIVVLIAGIYGQTSLFDAPFWWWTGLSEIRPRSSDYVAIFPFFAAVLLGMAAAKLSLSSGFTDTMARWQFSGLASESLKFIGRHSLIYYLVHQPIMIGILYLFLMVTA